MTPHQGHGPADGTTVEADTSHGTLRGIWHRGVARFAGIPYAAAPVGDRRFRPPVAPASWQGVRPADSFGPVAPQNPSIMEALFGGEAETWDEDCLSLNVWTPDPTAASPLPVMVWIHGGGFEMGSGSSPLYDGTSFAADGVVLVTVNYRLGAFGFLELGHLDPSRAGSGNVGLLDQVAALEWVRDNIAGFGGDPANVTVFGESAGAMSISLLLAMPRARGLFHRAITQSGAASAARTPELAASNTDEFMATAGLSTLEELLEAEPARLLAAHATMAASRVADPEAVIERTGNPLAFLSFRPVADGAELPEDPLGAIAAGSAAGVSLLIGTNSEEWKLFALMSPPPADDEALAQRAALVVTDPDAALAVYRDEQPGASVADLECALLTDLVFRIPAVRLVDAQAAHAPVWQYLWTWPSPAWGGMVGAAHAIELPFVFDLVEDQRLHVFVGPDAPRTLARATHDAWVAFARDGAPSADALAPWPTVDEPGRPVMVLDTEPKLVHDPGAAAREFWATPGAEMPQRRNST
jgi:para-nitrobenzyl esterase